METFTFTISNGIGKQGTMSTEFLGIVTDSTGVYAFTKESLCSPNLTAKRQPMLGST